MREEAIRVIEMLAPELSPNDADKAALALLVLWQAGFDKAKEEAAKLAEQHLSGWTRSDGTELSDYFAAIVRAMETKPR